MIPSGVILLFWSGDASIPSGWHLCDGSEGTVDLRDFFIVGAGLSFLVGDKGGSSSHSHDFFSDTHRHNLQSGPDIPLGLGFGGFTDYVEVAGVTSVVSNMPPYKSLRFIQKV